MNASEGDICNVLIKDEKFREEELERMNIQRENPDKPEKEGEKRDEEADKSESDSGAFAAFSTFVFTY